MCSYERIKELEEKISCKKLASEREREKENVAPCQEWNVAVGRSHCSACTHNFHFIPNPFLCRSQRFFDFGVQYAVCNSVDIFGAIVMAKDTTRRSEIKM
jgi:hypothetical protein